LTPYGAFGFLFVSDLIHAAQYDRAATSAIQSAQAKLAADTYDGAVGALGDVLALHSRMPRAKALTAYAAFLDSATTLRFGPDPARPSRVKELLSKLPSDAKAKYLDAAIGAQASEAQNWDKARSELIAAERQASGDPMELEVTLLRGEVELAVGDGAAALDPFKRAVALSKDARAHFGLARAYVALGNPANAKNELEATLAASPAHPGALTLRARTSGMGVDAARAMADLSAVLDGPVRGKASPSERSRAFAARAWLELEQGATNEAREAFAEAVKLDGNDADALDGQGRLFMADGRYAEALARFDTALQSAPGSPETIANDADAKLQLERLADAKQQLTAARTRFPTSIAVLLELGKVEQHLGNSEAGEADLRAAVAQADPSRSDAVEAYVALSELLSARGRVPDARAALEEAVAKLPPSSALDRAFGEVSELVGDYEGALSHYRAAIDKNAKDLAAHFRYAVALRRVHRLDAAAAELDRVAAADAEYPGLRLERGLLFQESGDVQKAIDEFKGALARAPQDADLQLRVGSAYVMIDRPDDAVPMLRQVLEKRPNSAEALHYIGRALMLKGGSSQAEALVYLKRAVALDPNRAEFHVYLAWAANDMAPAQLELARDEIDRALALDRQSADAYWQRGVLEHMEGAIEDAIKDENRALQLRPSRYEAHATLAECYQDRNDAAGALAEWSRALAGDKNAPGQADTQLHPYWHYQYGKLLMEKGERGPALTQLQSAVDAGEKLESRPAWLAPLEFLTAEALRAAGRKADAAARYRRFLDLAPTNSPDRAEAQRALGQLSPER
jgi:tetratricopeptide (TPR) repeat protein